MDPEGAVFAKETLVGSCGTCRYGVSAMQGHRDSMEDAHIATATMLPPNHGLFVVLDGHGGDEASEFASEELARILSDDPNFVAYTQRIQGNNKQMKNKNKMMKETIDLLEKAFTRSFVEMDRELYLNMCYGEEAGASSAGSTAVATLVTPDLLVCANIGDSRCVLASSSTSAPTSVTPCALSEDHTPDLEAEEKRILDAGGSIEMGRVDGELAVSRAFGDFELKDINGLMMDEYDPDDPDDVDQLLEYAKRQKVSAVPEIRVHQRNVTTDRFLVLACDGIWDVASNEDCVEWIADIIWHQGQDDMGIVCEKLLDICLKQGSRDNMTIAIVLFEGGQKLLVKSGSGRATRKRR
ncbi:linked kinase-associated serine/threonine phosphatase 2C [Seminavis robusta]|uniref:protein-serine/threonine phosphatase n=1 Tax=Seminavis robusta TaxID=568900 RepID=A0A9N8ECZ7_9STRA|nr:linked kinase-associated serine/threonine phosphatase 2C [Seminavis robusta]|eukprot:Sro909_g219050.1 linked kinase-associated serine/threonine phosphatase 2C (353) ;mRNA; r:33889-34947